MPRRNLQAGGGNGGLSLSIHNQDHIESRLSFDPDEIRFDAAIAQFSAALNTTDAERAAQMSHAALLHPAAAKVLATLDREWDGLARHREFPELALDNNTSEVRHEVARDEWTRRGEDQQMMLVA
jgi:hypothetical protein